MPDTDSFNSIAVDIWMPDAAFTNASYVFAKAIFT
jgi:hypothetical protein